MQVYYTYICIAVGNLLFYCSLKIEVNRGRARDFLNDFFADIVVIEELVKLVYVGV
jgi:hypothetical protein